MTPAISELERLGVAHTVHAYEHATGRTDFGIEAAEELGLDPDRVFKTLVCTAGPEHVVAIAPVSGQVSLKAVGRAIGAKRVEMCDLATAERVTGYVRGGISPVGQKQRLRTVLDEIALAFDEIYVSGGRRGLDIGLAPRELVRVCDAIVADIAV